MSSKSVEGWVYISAAVDSDRLFKIGRSRAPSRRRIAPQLIPQEARGELVLLHLIAAADAAALEARLHEHYSGQWHQGEWYFLSQDDIRQLQKWSTDQDVLKAIGPPQKRRVVHFLPAGVLRRATAHARRMKMSLAKFASVAMERFANELDGVPTDTESATR